MINKKKKILVVSVLVLSILVYVFSPKISNYFRWQRAADAAGGYPYEIGLSAVKIIPCVVSCSGGCCMGGSYCGYRDPATCMLYSEVSGAPSGGNGSVALFSKNIIAWAALYPGGQLIAGGMGPTLMDGGVLASDFNCFGTGCALIETGPIEKFKNWFANIVSDFIIAGKWEGKK